MYQWEALPYSIIENIIANTLGMRRSAVTVKPTGCGFDPHSRGRNNYLNLYFHFFALVSRLSEEMTILNSLFARVGTEPTISCSDSRTPVLLSAIDIVITI